MLDNSVDLDIFDQLVENTGETGEPAAPELPQDAAWIDPDALPESPA